MLRLGVAFYLGNEVTGLPGIHDQTSYQTLAERVLDGHGFTFAEGHWPATPAGEPTAHWSFVYTLFLAAVYAIVGVEPLVARLLQALLVGVLHTWLAYRLGKRIFGVTAGLSAALLSAIYAYFVYYAAGLLTESFYLVGILWTLAVALRLSQWTGGPTPPRLWIQLGFAVGLTCLLRQVFLLFVPVLFFWLVRDLRLRSHAGSTAHLLRSMTTAAIVTILLIAPWTARNYMAFSTFVPINTNAGFALYWGNHPVHGTSFIPVLPDAGSTYGALIPDQLRGLNEGQLDRALFRLALETVAADPVRYLKLSASRAREYFKFWPSADSSFISNVSRFLSFGLLLPIMVLGIVLGLRASLKGDAEVSTSGVALLLLWAVTYTLIHLATWTLIRYRLPVDAVLLLFAGFALSRVTRLFGSISATAVGGGRTL